MKTPRPGSMPTHECIAIYDGEEIVVVSPMSRLDCDRPRCVAAADIARLRAQMTDMDGIDASIAHTTHLMNDARRSMESWVLAREARLRADEVAAPGHLDTCPKREVPLDGRPCYYCAGS